MANNLELLIEGFLGKANDDLKQLIEKCYTESHRKYHTLDHLDQLFELFKFYRSLFTDDEYSILCGAALFHDVIYNVSRDDNETQSAKLAASWIEQNDVSQEFRKSIERLINDMYKPGVHFLNDFFQDADMAILAAPEEVYAQYAQDVKEEFTTYYTEDSFISGRKDFLAKLLRQPNIYRTSLFRNTQEVFAIKNVFTELENYK